jgi:uncharacterized membrane protein
MDIFLLLVVLATLIFIFRKLTGIKYDLSQLQQELQDLKKLISSSPLQPSEKQELKAIPPAPALPEPPQVQIKEEIQTVEWPELKTEIYPPKEKFSMPEAGGGRQETEGMKPAYMPATTKQNWFSKWLLDNPDIEKFIGENLINKIGIAVLVFGIAFFVKYAIDQDWINRVGRVSIGLLCGVILIFFANRLRKNYHAFSSVLIGGAITIFYFTIALAFHQYHLFDQGAAFGMMVIITIFAVAISILYDRIELGIIATVGGFITPFLVSQGDGNWLVLFSYLTILNVGLIILAFYKRWRIINFIAFFFTQIIYLGWVIMKAGHPGFEYEGIFIFGTVFYILFLLMNVIHHVVRGSKLKAFDFIILLSVNCCYYGAGIYLINESNVSQYGGLFTASLGIVNLILAYLFFRKSKADKKFIYLLIGITISFISLTAPVQLKGHYITLFWSAEMVVLLWLYQKSFIPLLKITVLLVTGLMLISLIMDWSVIYADNPNIHPILFNKGWITGLCSAISCWLVYRLLKKEADSFYAWHITNQLLRNIYLIASIVLLYTAGALEINDQFVKRMPATGIQVIYSQLYLTVFVLALLLLLTRFKTTVHSFLRLILPYIVLGIYILNIPDIHATEKLVLLNGQYRVWFAGGWLNAIFLLLLIWISIEYVRKNQPVFGFLMPHITWLTAIFCVVIFSVELRNLFIWMNYSDSLSFTKEESNFDKAGLTIVWAVSSFLMIWLGMKYSYKPLRITALVLFGCTLVKLFLFDIQDIAPGGKIIAFILLGALLLVISFMYQRLKNIIIDDAKNEK